MTQLDSALEAARRGDRHAFAELIRRYQDMAFAAALALLGDYHLAEDATQEAFVSAYFGLPALREPAAFPGWLRGIVRNHCFRLVRGRRPTLVPLDDALELSGADAGPEAQAERAEARDGVLGAVMALPDAQREIVALYYIGDYTQREVAALLELPVTTVNNRLHAARRRLKGGLKAMAREELQRHGLTEDFAATVGTIIDVRGPVIEAQFAADSMPQPLEAVALEEPGTLAVMQQLAEGRVRCIMLTEPGEVTRGLDVRTTGTVAQAPVSARVLREAAAILVRPAGGMPATIETGIKAVDLLCPLSAGGTFALYGGQGAGKLTLLAELLHRLTAGQEVSLLNFVQTGTGMAMRPLADDRLPNAAGSIDAFYLPVEDAADPSSQAVEAVRTTLDGAAFLSRSMALEGLYPAVDPLVAWSRLLTVEVVGQEHVEVVERVRETIRRFLVLREQPDMPRSAEEEMILATAERLRAYLTQPFFTGEPYTKVPGEWVPIAQTIQDCRAILSGKHNGVPVDAFRFTGTLEQILTRQEQAMA